MLKIKISGLKKFICENKFECLCFVLLTFVFFGHCWKILCASDDDVYGFLVAQQNNIAINANSDARAQGRFQFNIIGFVSWFPFIFNSFVIYKTLSYITIIFDSFMLFILVKKCVNRNVGMLSIIILMGFAQLDEYYDMFSGYVMGHQACIGFLLLGMWCFLKYYDTGKTKYLVFSEISMLWAQLFYETFLLFNLILLLIVFLKRKNDKNLIKQGLLDLRVHIIGSIIYVALYFGYGLLHQSSYVGNKIEIVSLSSSISTLVRFMIGKVPLRQIVLRGNLKDLINFYEPIYLVKAIFFAGIVCYIIQKAEKLDVKRTLAVIGLFILGMFLAPLLHAFTYKYVVICAHWKSYLPSFFCYFFLCAIMAAIIIMIYQHIHFKKILLMGIFGISFIVCLVTDLGNASFSQACEKEKIRRLAYYNIIQNEDFLSLNNDSTIYQPEWTGVYGNLEHVEQWLQKKYSKNFNLTYNMEDITTNENTYYLRYSQNVKAVYYGNLNTEFQTSNIRIRDVGEDEDFSLIIVGNEEVNSYTINGITANYGKTAIIPYEDAIEADYMQIDGANIAIDKIYFLKGKSLNNKIE